MPVLSDLQHFISFPSVSAQSRHTKDVRSCAEWLKNYLNESGLRSSSLFETELHPVVFGERIEDSTFPTVLIYGHYDVQPADPLTNWSRPPFNPVIKDNYIFGRGASDDKGQLFIHITAIRQLLREKGKLPVNVKVLFEGEEEIGSLHLKKFIRKNKELLKADVAVVSDMKIVSPQQPAITYGLRGSLNFEVTLYGQKKELHSGTFGGAIYNPLQALCEIIGRLHSDDGKILIDGFYDTIQLPTEEEREYALQNAASDSAILKDAGTDYDWGNKRFTCYEKTTMLPSITICGLQGGYTGEGIKSIIPHKAVAKFNARLSPGQIPEETANKIKSFFKKVCPENFLIDINFSMMAGPVIQSRNSDYLKAAAHAYEKGFGKYPVFLRSGGTIPVVSMLQEQLDIPVLMMGFALGSDDMHAADEKFYLPNFFNGIKTIKQFLINVNTIYSSERLKYIKTNRDETIYH